MDGLEVSPLHIHTQPNRGPETPNQSPVQSWRGLSPDQPYGLKCLHLQSGTGSHQQASTPAAQGAAGLLVPKRARLIPLPLLPKILASPITVGVWLCAECRWTHLSEGWPVLSGRSQLFPSLKSCEQLGQVGPPSQSDSSCPELVPSLTLVHRGKSG